MIIPEINKCNKRSLRSISRINAAIKRVERFQSIPYAFLAHSEYESISTLVIGAAGSPGGNAGVPPASSGSLAGGTPAPPGPKRFHGTVTLDATRVGRDAGKIADELISHLAGLVGANVTVTLEIEADIPSGAPDSVVRTVTENSRSLKFTSHGFESE